MVWRRVRQKGFNAELWQGHLGTVDWARERIYSLALGHDGCVFESLDLKDFTLEQKLVPDGPRQDVSTILHPQTRELWAIEGGRGEVFALNPKTEQLRRLGGGPDTGRYYGARTYWNPVTQRVGVFGGYGLFAVTNERSEFDATGSSMLDQGG